MGEQPDVKLTETKCPRCGGTLEVDKARKEAVCPYCDSRFLMEEGPEAAGYAFEKGRMRAEQEEALKHLIPSTVKHPYNPNKAYKASTEYVPPTYKEQPVQYYPPAPKKSFLLWWVLGWIFCFPIPLSILIGRSKMPLFFKILLIGVLWAAVIFLILANQ